MFAPFHPILSRAEESAWLAITWFDETSLGALMLVAFLLQLVSHRLPQPSSSWVPPVSSGVFLLGYFMHRYLLDGDRFNYLLASLLRSLLASCIVWSIAELIVLAALAVSHQIENWKRLTFGRAFQLWHGIVERWRRLRQRRLRRTPGRPPPAVASPPRAVMLRQRAEAARADYEAEVAALVGLPLDEDEREMLLNQAKQRLLGRLKQEE